MKRFKKLAIIIKDPLRGMRACLRRASSLYKNYTIRALWLLGRVPHSWPGASKLYCNNQSYEAFFADIKNNWHCAELDVFDQSIIDQAYASLDVYGNFCGLTINDPMPPWHEDVRLRGSNNAHKRFFTRGWYSSIKIHTTYEKSLGSDIKTPWLLGRCHHFVLWGYAYKHTRDKKFVDAFKKHTESFLNENPFLYGVQWKSPLEVSLRAINWLCALSCFIESDELSPGWWQTIICSLLDHWWYLKHHWELYDGKTNNHYLGNLVGYWWLCTFFKHSAVIDNQRIWCAQRLCAEVNKQLLPDGFFYEGSTAYHHLCMNLVTLALSRDNEKYCESLGELHQKMRDRMEMLYYNNDDFVLIGDNDSSPALHQLIMQLWSKNIAVLTHAQQLYEAQSFGIQIIKNDHIHATLRHHVYDARQPSGHFHHDCASITVALDGVPFIIDPGTYVYTPSAHWRNYLRSHQAHASCYSKDTSYGDTDLFSLNVPAQTWQGSSLHIADTSMMATQCTCRGFKHERFIFLNTKHKKIHIHDRIHSLKSIEIEWNFPIVGNVIHRSENEVLIETENSEWRLQSDQLTWRTQQNWYAPSYGILEPCTFMRASKRVDGEWRVDIELYW